MPGGERQFVDGRRAGTWTLGAIGCRCLTGRSYRCRRRPLRLRVGPAGIGMGEVTRKESFFSWQDIAAVTWAARRPPATPARGGVVWPLPGSRPHDSPSCLVDGHKAFALVRLDRLPGGAEAVVPVVREYAGERYAETAWPPAENRLRGLPGHRLGCPRQTASEPGGVGEMTVAVMGAARIQKIINLTSAVAG
ncbi:hypothetical protein [Actinacidiphila glaucinigra]|uniref:hypothetical protein n=1 Tax=Actinacidiphila glaucinigra TaxID=235986 RepID=UPI0036EBB3CC